MEPIRVTTRAERLKCLEAAHNNLFFVPARDVMIDLLTDSGTGSLSAGQWAGMMMADESYAAADSWFRFEAAVQDIFGFDHVIPTHQGRAAEHLLFKVLLKDKDKNSDTAALDPKDLIVPSNTHFDTTRANIEDRKTKALDIPCPESKRLSEELPFKGNMDTVALTQLLEEQGERIPFVMITITNNAAGGQPVSLANLREVQKLCQQHKKPFYIDACRFAENAYFIQQREHPEMTIRQIVREIFALADGCTMSAKKDGLSNMGGFLALRDAKLAQVFRTRLVVTEGFPTYGGLSGRDLESVAVGLYEALDPNYLKNRVGTIDYVVKALQKRGIPVLTPAGGHAIFLDAKRFCPDMQFPGQAVALELYIQGGIRACEIGSVMFEGVAPHELVRMAVPRRTYTQSHFDYLVDVIQQVWQRRESIADVKITYDPPVLRHFSAHFERVTS